MDDALIPDIETHPWPPFIPEGARILILGTFPPQAKRWSMDFYYPNRTNDFWYMMGLIFCGDKNSLLAPDGKKFDIEAIKALLTEYHIALNDTGRKVRRLKGNASDKFLEILEPVPLYDLLKQMPQCRTLCTTGEKAASVIAELTNTPVPKKGDCTESADGLTIWRMPSTSRAYPLPLDRKAAFYEVMFRKAGIL